MAVESFCFGTVSKIRSMPHRVMWQKLLPLLAAERISYFLNTGIGMITMVPGH